MLDPLHLQPMMLPNNINKFTRGRNEEELPPKKNKKNVQKYPHWKIETTLPTRDLNGGNKGQMGRHSRYYPWPIHRHGPTFIAVVYLYIPLHKTL